MKQFFRLLALLLILGSAPCRAEDVVIVHNFQTLFSAGNLTITPNAGLEANKIGTVNDGIVYTCGDDVVFGSDLATSTKKTINFSGNSKRLEVSLINDLKEIQLKNTMASGSMSHDFRIKLSTDGSSWGEPIYFAEVLGKSMCNVAFPKGNYYVRIYTSDAINVSITELRFVTEPEDCNCFVYTP